MPCMGVGAPTGASRLPGDPGDLGGRVCNPCLPPSAPGGQQLARVKLLLVAMKRSFSELSRGQVNKFPPPCCSDQPVLGSGKTAWNDT